MNLEIKIEELRKKSLFIGVPMYGGQCMGMFMKSCLDLQGLLQHYGINQRFSFIFNESLITRARNYITDEFRRSGMTNLLFIDSDIHFDPKDVITLLALDKDIIGGPYPKKSINWAGIKEAITKNPSIDPAVLNSLVGQYVFNPVHGTTQFNIGEPIEVLEIGTGYMMIKKEVFDKMDEVYSDTIKYKPDHVGQAFFDGSRYINAYFDCVIDKKRTIKLADGTEKEVGGSDRYLSEDYTFCQRARDIGVKTWICPWMKTVHIGTFGFTGDLAAIANHLGKL
jgi:hypothetical protein